MPKRKKMKRETVESGETVPSPPQEAVELAAAEPEVLVQRRPRREVPWALARRWTSEMKRQTKKHERILKAFRKQEAGWDDQRKVFARLDEVSAKAFSKHGGLNKLNNKISLGALNDHNQEAHVRWIRKYYLEKEALKATQNQLSLALG